jgi:hypothetical protein
MAPPASVEGDNIRQDFDNAGELVFGRTSRLLRAAQRLDAEYTRSATETRVSARALQLEAEQPGDLVQLNCFNLPSPNAPAAPPKRASRRRIHSQRHRNARLGAECIRGATEMSV